jgi:hypothetical protein
MVIFTGYRRFVNLDSAEIAKYLTQRHRGHGENKSITRTITRAIASKSQFTRTVN